MAIKSKRFEPLEHRKNQTFGRWLDSKIFIQKFLKLLQIYFVFQCCELIFECCSQCFNTLRVKLGLKIFNFLICWKVFHLTFQMRRILHYILSSGRKIRLPFLSLFCFLLKSFHLCGKLHFFVLSLKI